MTAGIAGAAIAVWISFRFLVRPRQALDDAPPPA